jgi:protein TonB
MEKNKILEADILDIIFDGRNKDYGAYRLRKYYKETVTKALVITGSVLVLVLSGTVLAGNNKDSDRDIVNTVDTRLAEIKEDPPPLPPPPPPPPELPPPVDLNQVRFTPPEIVNDDEVAPEDKIQEITDETAISKETIVTDQTVQIIQAPVDDKGTGINEVKKKDDENEIFVKVEKEAGFDGGDDGWRAYLRKTLNPDVPIDNGAGAGKFTVIVKFVVSKDGSVSGVTCENDPGFGMCQEAVRVIKKTKNWTPAIQNGHHVNAYRRQPIVFVVE